MTEETHSGGAKGRPRKDASAPGPLVEPTGPVIEQPSRRRFIGWLLGVGGAITAALMAIPLVRLSLYPALAQGTAGEPWSDLGPIDQYSTLSAPVQRVVKIQALDGWQQTISEKVVYVTKGPDGKVRVLTAVCPHLGCQVAWVPQADHFHCPCHGSVFAPDGKYLSGPAPRGMDTLPIENQGGRLRMRYEYFRNLAPDKEVIS